MGSQNAIGLEAVLITSQFEKGLNTYLKGQKQIQSSTSKTVSSATKSTNALGSAFTSLGSKVVAFGATALGGQALLDFGVQSFQAAASAERLGLATENLGKKFGISGDEIVSSIQNASGFTISRLDAMRQANQAMLLGVADSVPAFARMTEIAVVLGRAMGQDAAKSVEDLTIALGRGSTEILDNLGITLKVGEANEIFAASLGKTVSQLTDAERKQAFLNEALRRGEEAMIQIGGVTNDTAAGMEQLSAAVSDFQVAFGGFLTQASESSGVTTILTDGLRSWTFVLGEAIPAIQESNAAIEAGKPALDSYFASVLQSAKSVEDLSSIQGQSVSDFESVRSQLIGTTRSFEEYQQKTALIKSVTEEAGGELEIYGARLNVTRQEYLKVQKAIASTAAIERKEIEVSKQLAAANEEVNEAVRLAAQQAAMAGPSYDSLVISQAKLAEIGLEAAAAQITLAKNVFAQDIPEQAALVPGTQQELIEQNRIDTARRSFAKTQVEVDVDSGGISKSINDGLQAIKSAIGQVSGLTFEENLPVEETFRIDEWVRRLQAVATDGNNEWVDAITQQFGGQEFFKPFEDAIASGDPSAIENAAQGLIDGDFLFNLMDIDGAVSEVEDILKQQDLQKKINDAILEAIGQEGGEVPTAGGDASPIINALGLGSDVDLATPISDQIEALDIPTIVSDALGGGEEGSVNPLLALLGLGEDGIFNAAVETLTGETLPIITEAFNQFFLSSALGLENMILATDSENMILQDMAGTSIPSLQNSVIAMSGIFIAKLAEIDKKLDTTTKNVKKLADTIGGEVVSSINKAKEVTEDWLNAMRAAKGLFDSLRGAGGKPGQPAHNGLGFAGGTSGFTVPAGFPNDSFPINVESGEKVVVAPRGKTIEGVLGMGGSSVEVNISGVTISNGMDLNMFGNRVRQAVTEGMAG